LVVSGVSGGLVVSGVSGGLVVSGVSGGLVVSGVSGGLVCRLGFGFALGSSLALGLSALPSVSSLLLSDDVGDSLWGSAGPSSSANAVPITPRPNTVKITVQILCRTNQFRVSPSGVAVLMISPML
jgi:hypothetical protein